tara:strand:- start:134 stop:667 length:534 start_codon:yes stop_codon:yes gene_type:complete
MTETKCISCEEIIDIESGCSADRGEHKGEPLCENCYCDDMGEPIVTASRGKDKQTYYCGNYTSDADYEDNAIAEYFDSVKWHSCDAWRGYYKGEAPAGYEQMVDSWFGSVDGYFPDDIVGRFHEAYESGELDGIEYFAAFPRTSNVFSSGIEVYIHNQQVDESKSIIGINDEVGNAS